MADSSAQLGNIPTYSESASELQLKEGNHNTSAEVSMENNQQKTAYENTNKDNAFDSTDRKELNEQDPDAQNNQIDLATRGSPVNLNANSNDHSAVDFQRGNSSLELEQQHSSEQVAEETAQNDENSNRQAGLQSYEERSDQLDPVVLTIKPQDFINLSQTTSNEGMDQSSGLQSKENSSETGQNVELKLNLTEGENSSPKNRKTSMGGSQRERLRENLVVSTSKNKLAEPIDEEKESASEKVTKQKEEEVKNTQAPSSALLSKPQQQKKVTLADFTTVGQIGRGSYGEVNLVKKKPGKKLYAMKVLDKKFLKMERKEYQAHVEREMLMKLNHPSVVKMHYSFQDHTKLYFVLEYLSGGEFSDYLRIQKKLEPHACRFYAAEIVVILEYLHSNGIAHRDLKPENLMMDGEGHLKIIDFGTAKYTNSKKRTAELFGKKKESEDTGVEIDPELTRKFEHRSTFVGTPQYVSPEMLSDSDCGGPADLWALGCIIYFMASGKLPFNAGTEYILFQKIKEGDFVYPEDMDDDTKDVISRLLVKTPEERLGSGPKESGNDYSALKQHKFFAGIDFNKILTQKPPLVEVKSPFRNKGKRASTPNEFPIYQQNPAPTLKSQKETKANVNSETTPNPENQPKEQQQLNTQETQDKTGRNSKPQSQPHSGDKKIILSGLIAKRHPYFIFFQTRLLVLSEVSGESFLRYYNPSNNELRREFPLIPTTFAEIEGPNKFTITTATEKYNFKTLDHPPEKWVQMINACCRRPSKSRAQLSALENTLMKTSKK